LCQLKSPKGDKTRFVSNITPGIFGMIFDEIDKDAKVKLAIEMTERKVAIFENTDRNKVNKS